MANYVEQSLTTGENVIYTAKLSKVWFITSLILWGLLTLVLILPIIGFIWVIIRYLTTEVAVTNKRFIYKKGWISRYTNEISIRKIEGCSSYQGILGRMMGYGTVMVRGTGADKATVTLIDNPMELQRAVNEAVHDFGVK